MNDRSNDDTDAPPTRKKSERWGYALTALLSPLVFGFTGYNFWRLATEGEIYIRYQGRFVPPDGSLYFWATLLFYIVMFVGSAIVMLLFFAWATGRLRDEAGNDAGTGTE